MCLAGQYTPVTSAGLCQQPISCRCCSQATSCSIAPKCTAVTLECPIYDFLYSMGAHSQSSGYSHYTAVCENYLKGFCACIKPKKNTSCLYDLRISFSICFHLGVFLPCSLSVENKWGPFEMNRIFHVGSISCAYSVLCSLSSLQRLEGAWWIFCSHTIRNIL